MSVRAIRGAVTVESNTYQEIISKTKQLLTELISKNHIQHEDMISIFFTATKDVDAAFPPVAAREIGLTNVPLMCAVEMDVEGSLKNCIRIMMHVNSNKSLDDVKHIYLGEAKKLRPDLSDD